ncbi:CPBP family intramembrane glutamic endopeptidase [uncultured Albimonas sp.]|uniref:CPBP family intramembrane glutamic endopeptidase n=1 Tax=uncultured Albimonas sp. TaxID=1331701 RepID=UPI0030EBD586
MTRFTHPLVAYAAPAVRGASLVRTVVGVALTVGFVFLFVKVARLGIAAALLGPDGIAARDASTVHSPLGVLLTLGAFLAVWPALWLSLPLVHRRPANTLFGPQGRIDWRHFRLGLAVALAVGAAAWLPLILVHGREIAVFPSLSGWLGLALLAAPLIFVQCAAEEMLFRGYLLQQFAARSLSIIGWSVAPSILFGFAHPTEGAWLGFSWYHFFFGLIMAAVTSRTANLGAAIGLHFGINLVNIAFVSPQELVSGLALFVVPQTVDSFAPRVAYVVMMFIGAVVFMGYMDFRFLRAWRAARKAEKAEQLARATAPPANGDPPGPWPRGSLDPDAPGPDPDHGPPVPAE